MNKVKIFQANQNARTALEAIVRIDLEVQQIKNDLEKIKKILYAKNITDARNQ